MKKHILWLLIGWLCLGVGPASSQGLRSGEAAIYLKNGDLVVDRILDISSTRLVLETENRGEFPLRDLWMINFVNDKWNFPDERNMIEGGGHYVFLKDGGITSGRITDFSSEQRVFDLDTGEKIAIGRIRRIYFSKNVPAGLMSEVREERKEGTFLSVGPGGDREIVCETGWHVLESDPNTPLKKWRWTSREARCLVANPRRDALLVIKGGANKDIMPNQRVTFRINDLTLDEFIPGENVFEKSYNIRREMLGGGDEFTLTIVVDRTFIPAKVILRNKDERELGVQISYIYLFER